MTKEERVIEIKEHIDAVYGADCAYYNVDGFAIADELDNAGYRKASDVAREIFADIETAFARVGVLPHNVGLVDFKVIAELKKKYESEEDL